MATVLRHPSLARRDFLLGGSALAAAAAFSAGCGARPTLQNSGGVTLVYQASSAKSSELETANMAGLVKGRVDPRTRLRGLVIRVVEDGKIEINIPNQPGVDIERIKRRIAMKGHVELLITANAKDHAGEIELARKSVANEVMLDDETMVAKWIDLPPLDELADSQLDLASMVVRDDTGNPITPPAGGANAAFAKAMKANGVSRLQALVVYDLEGQNFDESFLASVDATHDGLGAPSVSFSTTEAGAEVLKAVTTKNQPTSIGYPRLLAIVVDGRLMSAPRIHSPITGRGQITGAFTQQQVDDLVTVLRAGRFPHDLHPDPISESVIDAGE